MKFILQVLTTAILGYVLELFLPWWSIAVAAFLAGLILRTDANFLAGLLGISLLWLLAAFITDHSATTRLADKVAEIFSLSKPLLFVVTGLIGGLVGGFAAMTGGALHKGRRKVKYY